MIKKYDKLHSNMVRVLSAVMQQGGIIEQTDQKSLREFESKTLDFLINQFGQIAENQEQKLQQYKSRLDLISNEYGNYIVKNYKKHN